MITPNDFRNGTTFERDGQYFRVLEFLHVKPGKGPAFVRAKIQNLKTGAITDETFRTEEKLKDIRVERRETTYLYKEGEMVVVMDSETYDQYSLPNELLGQQAKLLGEGQTVYIEVCEENIIDAYLPANVVVEVIHAEPWVKGDTATSATKPAVVQGGVTIQVPLFVNVGEFVKIDTRTLTYVERVKRE